MPIDDLNAIVVLDEPDGEHEARAWGANIRRHRELLEMTQEQLAAVLQTRQSVISQWETGAKAPSRRNQRRIAKALRVAKPGRDLFPWVDAA